MPYKTLTSIAAFIILATQLTACQVDNKDGISDETHQTVLKMEQERLVFEYEGILRHFALEEYHLMSRISGTAVPENFKSLGPIPSVLYSDLDFKIVGHSYVKFVTELNIGCDNGTYYVQFGKKEEISFEDLINQGKWSTLHLKICGDLTVPERRKLLVYGAESAHLKDFNISTSRNSLFSLSIRNATYAGEAPRISIASPSVLKIRFF